MVKWARGASERTFEQSVANSKKEPNVTDAARCADDWKQRLADIAL
jgi:hypothetical protein